MNLKTLLRCIFYATCLFCANNIASQNILDTSYWTTGSSSWGVLYFLNNGSESENFREFGENHVGDDVILWKSKSDGDNGPNGGWNTNYYQVFNYNTVRFSVWIKKTNSHSGTTYFGYNAYGNGYYDSLPLDGNFNNNSHPSNPYFFAGELPELDRWYLLVGYVHKNGHIGTTNLGRIYDGITGEEVLELTDYKFLSTSNMVRHRAYLNNATNPNDIQYFCEPRMEIVNGNEWTLNQLLSLNPDSKLLFTYDNAGNQKQRFYCSALGCPVPGAPAGRVVSKDIIASKEIEPIEDDDSDVLESQLTASPNPTKGMVSLRFTSNAELTLANDINVYNSGGIMVLSLSSQAKNEIDLDLTNLSTGIYLVHMHLSNGTSITKQIIKN
jgi:hypothetical protein